MARPRRLLVTGFGPFPTMPVNPSARAAVSLAGSPRWRRFGIEATCRILTTAYATLPDELDPALAAADAVLMIGVAGRAARIRVERRATSRRSLLFPDASGCRAGSLAAREMPAARRTRVNPHAALALLRGQGLPARISRDAGRYLCNAAYFRALAIPAPVLFVHVPKTTRSLPRPGRLHRRRRPVDALREALFGIGLLMMREARPAPI